MNGNSVKTTLFNQVVQSGLGKIQHCRIPSRLTHASVVDIKTVGKTDILMFNNVADLIFEIRQRGIPEEAVFMNIAEGTFHGASLLAADSRYPLVHKVNIVVLNSFNLFG